MPRQNAPKLLQQDSINFRCFDPIEAPPLSLTFHFDARPRGGFDRLGSALLLLAAFLAIIVFLPPEGRVAAPLHATVDRLLGRAAFMLPLGCAVTGAILVARSISPGLTLPVRRVAGVVILLVGVLIGEQLLAGSQQDAGSGVVGAWLSGTLTDLFGIVLTAALVLVALVLGVALVFGVKPRMPVRAPSTEQVRAEVDATR